MNELEQIRRLGEADALVDRIDKEILDAERRIPAAEAEVAQSAAARDAARRALTTARDEERRIDGEVATARQRRSSALRALDQGLGDPTAVQHQITTSNAHIDELETKQLALMEQIEGLAASMARLETAWKAAMAHLDAERAAVPPILAANRSNRVRAWAERTVAFEPLPRDLQNRYTTVRTKRKTAVTTALDGYCVRCTQAIPKRDLLDLDKGLLHACPGCSRYVVGR
jgi:predicted  nucleic acid-binding Zn-ribbon protein